MAVSPADNLTSASGEAQRFHLKTMFVAHQKFATLSSNRPLLNGNMRVMGSRIVGNGARGGRKGRKSMIVVSTVTKPKRMNKRPLSQCQHSGCGIVRADDWIGSAGAASRRAARRRPPAFPVSPAPRAATRVRPRHRRSRSATTHGRNRNVEPDGRTVRTSIQGRLRPGRRRSGSPATRDNVNQPEP